MKLMGNRCERKPCCCCNLYEQISGLSAFAAQNRALPVPTRQTGNVLTVDGVVTPGFERPRRNAVEGGLKGPVDIPELN